MSLKRRNYENVAICYWNIWEQTKHPKAECDIKCLQQILTWVGGREVNFCHNFRLDVFLGSIYCHKSILGFLTDDISIAYRHTTIHSLWPLCAWMMDYLALTAWNCSGCKRHVVWVTHLSVCIHFSVRVHAGGRSKNVWGCTRTLIDISHTAHHPVLSIYISKLLHARTHQCQKNTHCLTCSFPAPKDRSGTAVTCEVMKLEGVRLSRLWKSPV